METISLKMEETMVSNIDHCLKGHNFGTRTEFIRSAIREKLGELQKDDLMKQFLSLNGKAKKTTTDTERKQIREQVFEELLKEHNIH